MPKYKVSVDFVVEANNHLAAEDMVDDFIYAQEYWTVTKVEEI